uniref:Uncharacterized protein n=1 Tax=Anguilla anguilla TaxID=7936 RepID=A0A0E9XTM8_ANGAN
MNACFCYCSVTTTQYILKSHCLSIELVCLCYLSKNRFSCRF